MHLPDYFSTIRGAAFSRGGSREMPSGAQMVESSYDGQILADIGVTSCDWLVPK